MIHSKAQQHDHCRSVQDRTIQVSRNLQHQEADHEVSENHPGRRHRLRSYASPQIQPKKAQLKQKDWYQVHEARPWRGKHVPDRASDANGGRKEN